MLDIYADNTYYKENYSCIPDEELEKALKSASRHIDILTYNRIVGRGINNLTEFQQEIIKEVCCEMANFEYENQDLIDSVFKNYAINGVSMSFGDNWNIKIQNGIAVKIDIFKKLSQTGLCSRRII